MTLSFTDLFTITDTNHYTAKKNIRIGALVIPQHHTIDPKHPDVGIAIADWVYHSFEVDIVNDDTFVIKRIIY